MGEFWAAPGRWVALTTSAAQEGPRVVTAVLESLAQQRATGVLAVDGNPAGTIYFDQGRIAFAQASWTPDLVARLRGVVPPAAAWQDLLASRDPADPDIGTLLVQRHYLNRDQLRTLVRSAVVDAFIVLTQSLPGESSFADVRFEGPGAHWAGRFSRLRLESVRTEAADRARRLVRAGLSPAAPVSLADLARPSAILGREQWAMACRLTDPVSAVDLAWRHGLALYEVLDTLGDLVRAGLCSAPLSMAPRPAIAAAPAGTVDLARTVRRRPGSALAPIPLVQPEADRAPLATRRPAAPLPSRADLLSAPCPPGLAEPGLGDPEGQDEADFDPPATELLRRVLGGLRKLS
jgi:hypothetical protein